MPTSLRIVPVLLCSLLAAASFSTHANPGEKPLSQIVQSVESHGTATQAERERRHWEVKVCPRRGRCLEFQLDPVTGQELRRRNEASSDRLPPANAQPLSAIIASLEQRELGSIVEIDFDDGLWEADVRPANGPRIEVHIDPFDARIVRCRGGRGCPTL